MEKALVKLKQTAVVKQVAAGREFTVTVAVIIDHLTLFVLPLLRAQLFLVNQLRLCSRLDCCNIHLGLLHQSS